MNSIRKISLAAGVALALTATGLLAQSDDNAVIATVNGATITERQLQDYIDQRTQGQGASLPDEARQQLAQELINVTLLAQKAREEGLHENPEVAVRLANMEATALAQAAVQQFGEGQSESISDEDVQSFYDEQFAGSGGGKEFKARHILISDEAKARELITEISEGADFATLAEENSEGPSAPQGGDLGWFSPDAMVPPFAEAIATMEVGSVSEEPVQTRFGWHVIKLEDVREASPPSLEEVRPQILNAIARSRVEDHLRKLRTDGNIDYKAEWAKPSQGE